MPQITIDVTAPQGQRIAAAYGKLLGLTEEDSTTPRPATLSEVKQQLVRELRAVVHQQELSAAQAAVVVLPLGDVA